MRKLAKIRLRGRGGAGRICGAGRLVMMMEDRDFAGFGMMKKA